MLCMPIACNARRPFRHKTEPRKKKPPHLPTSFTGPTGSCSHNGWRRLRSAAIPEWNEATALAALTVELVPFVALDGNVQGYAQPVGRSQSTPSQRFRTRRSSTNWPTLCWVTATNPVSRNQRLCRATSAKSKLRPLRFFAASLWDSLGAEYSRGYIQEWGKGQPINERSGTTDLSRCDQILRRRSRRRRCPVSAESIATKTGPLPRLRSGNSLPSRRRIRSPNGRRRSRFLVLPLLRIDHVDILDSEGNVIASQDDLYAP